MCDDKPALASASACTSSAKSQSFVPSARNFPNVGFRLFESGRAVQWGTPSVTIRRGFGVVALTWHRVVNSLSQTMEEEIKPRDVVREAECHPRRPLFVPMFGRSGIIVMGAAKRDVAQVIDLVRRHLNQQDVRRR
jgi:hypothetical protein